ncbi:MAG: hypothetical protein ABI954_14665 [Pyrinomonadaceae bacterium]
MTIQVQVMKIGDGFVLPLSQEVVERLGIKEGGQIELSTAEDAVILRPSQTENNGQQEFRKLKNEMFERYTDVFTALAEGAK